MPCRDYDSTPSVVYRDDPKTKKLLEEQKAKLDLVTRLLCFVLTNAPTPFWQELSKAKKTAAHGPTAYEELCAWWQEHQLEDKRERKRLRQAALAKLSPEEKEALGLD